MSEIKQDYYTNPQGFQLYTYFSKVLTPNFGFQFSLEQGFFLLSAFKYAVRAGRKPDNPEEKDLKKIDDYIELLVNAVEVEEFDKLLASAEIHQWLSIHVEAFERFNGEDL